MSLLFRPDCPPVLEESLYITANEWSTSAILPIAIKRTEKRHITEAFLNACAKQKSRQEMRYVISLPRAVPFSKNILRASITNCTDAAGVLELLLETKAGFEFEISESTLVEAVSNHNFALELVQILSSQCSSLPVTEAALVTIVGDYRSGIATFEFLLQHYQSVDDILTDNVLATIRGDNIEFMEHFAGKRPDFAVKEEFLIAAINPYSTNMATLRILLSQHGAAPISLSVLEAAIERGNKSMVNLILKSPGAPRPDAGQLNHAAKGLHPNRSDEHSGFDNILSAASTEGMPNEYSIGELSTSRFADASSTYSGPFPDTSCLLEVVAVRRDGKFVVQYLLSRYPKTVVTQRARLAAAGNEEAATSLLGLLIKHSPRKIDMELLRSAAGNRFRGTQMIELLFTSYAMDAKVESEVIEAALENPYCGRLIFELIIGRLPQLIITQDHINAASENTTLRDVLLQRRLE